MKLLGLAVLVGATSGAMSGCNSTVTTTGGGGTTADPYYHAWYDVYGNYCTNGYPESGCNFYADGTKISANGDPYSANMTLYYDLWTYTDSYGTRRSYTGYAWLSTDGILYDSYGDALNELTSTGGSNDVIGDAAAKETQVQTAVGKAFAAKYSLNEDQGITISKTLQDWANLGKDRSRTADDIAAYSQRLYGLDATKTMAALQQAVATQNQQPIEDLNVDVAAHWGTTPEVSKQILKGWYKDQAAAYGVQ